MAGNGTRRDRAADSSRVLPEFFRKSSIYWKLIMHFESFA